MKMHACVTYDKKSVMNLQCGRVLTCCKNEQSNGIDNQIKLSLKHINLLQNNRSVPPLRLGSSETFVGTFEGILKASLAAFGISWHE
jgi:hypothetical protein